MKSNIETTIKLDPQLGSAVDEADSLLASIAGPLAGQLHSDWKLQKDAKTRPVLTLTVSDWTGEVSAEFAPDELARPYHLYSRLNRVWGDLLQSRSRTQLNEMNELIGQLVEEDRPWRNQSILK